MALAALALRQEKNTVQSAWKLKCSEKEEGWGDPIEIFFTEG